MIQNEYFFIHFMTTKYYYYFTISQLFLTTLLIGWTLLYHSAPFSLQLIIMLLLSIDILIKYFSQGDENFWKSGWNRCDCFVGGFLGILLFVEAILNSQMGMEQASQVLLFLRGISQLLRVFRLVKQSNDSKQMQQFADTQLNLQLEHTQQISEPSNL